MIDEFTEITSLISILIDDTTTFPAVETALTDDDGILGSQRGLRLTAVSGDSNNLLSSGVASGEFACAAPQNAAGTSTVQWDGADSTFDLDVNGLGGIDFTQSDAFAIRLSAQTDVATSLEVRVYSSATSVCSTQVNLPGDNTNQDYILEYTNFDSTDCDFTSVGAVEIEVQLGNNVDVIIQVVSVYGPIPVTPTTSATPSPTPSPTSSPSAQASPTPSPSQTPSPSERCICRCPQFTCEVFRADGYNYYDNYRNVIQVVKNLFSF